MIDLGLLPAAGRGVRAYPKSSYVPKPMLEIAGTSLVQRNLELMRDVLGIREIVVIVGYLGDQIRKHLGDGTEFGVKIEYVECAQPDIGLAQGIALAEPLLDRPFVTVLADELYIGSNHAELRAPDDDYFAVCAAMHTDDPRLIQRNYSVAIAGGAIVDVEEKPADPQTDLLGCGTYIFTPELFDRIRATPPSARSLMSSAALRAKALGAFARSCSTGTI
jgi:NDP-sugar pyrophosphorylase family protein